ncbi:uncharacterized protein LOC103317756 [Nasonia vitripennis]|uniref:DUF4812 domain-containing protein n=1 Tax=Nasonia vitripennis TaxID=7425 RepID=A0A7M7HGM1_NASVI|nr:uncharacterized protein LOC103317756 [Nasonia vitripennis]
MQRKCCAHCPGSVTRTGDPIREHVCTVPEYVGGSLRVSSLSGRHVCKDGRTKSAKGTEMPEPTGSCFDRFATAKKFHAENLQHQPLPDKVDDAIFTKDKKAEDPCMCEAVKRCQKIVPRRQQNRKKEINRVHKYAPALGCKKPMTYMDLAICWETPIDPSYEPARPAHIDGSDGGPAPAIFALVQHAESQTDCKDGCIPGMREVEDGEECEHHQPCDKCGQNGINPATEANDDLCKNLDSLHITSPRNSKPGVGAAARCKRAHFLRHCVACCNKSEPKKPCRARSASCLQKNGCTVVARKNNGLPGKAHVPRPRTPYARRSFCIDTLAPPFSIVTGCRDADYPEHWRLTSIYQQSYRNPRKMREGRTILSYDRSYL